jgi:hypothetical protein
METICRNYEIQFIIQRFLESLNSETMHFWTYFDVNYFYYLHMKNSFLKFIFETPCIFHTNYHVAD